MWLPLNVGASWLLPAYHHLGWLWDISSKLPSFSGLLWCVLWHIFISLLMHMCMDPNSIGMSQVPNGLHCCPHLKHPSRMRKPNPLRLVLGVDGNISLNFRVRKAP